MSATRLPGKPLLKINGLSIISHVFKKAEEASIGDVVVAAEDQEIIVDVKQNGGHAMLTNKEHKTGTDRIYEVLQKLIHKNLSDVGGVKYNKEELAYAEAISLTFGDNKKKLSVSEEIQPYVYYKETKSGGSTDVGDVSWAVPTGGFSTATYVPGTAGHSWQAASCTGTSIGIKGMLNAAKVMALTAYDLFTNTGLILSAQKEFKEKRGEDFEYNPLIGDRDPALNYRK